MWPFCINHQEPEILRSEIFTKWDAFAPHHLWVQKVQFLLITAAECPHHLWQSKNDKIAFIGPRHIPNVWGKKLAAVLCGTWNINFRWREFFFAKWHFIFAQIYSTYYCWIPKLPWYSVNLSLPWWMEIQYTKWMGSWGFHSLCVLCVRTCDQLPTCYRPTGSTDISYSNTSTTR